MTPDSRIIKTLSINYFNALEIENTIESQLKQAKQTRKELQEHLIEEAIQNGTPVITRFELENGEEVAKEQYSVGYETIYFPMGGELKDPSKRKELFSELETLGITDPQNRIETINEISNESDPEKQKKMIQKLQELGMVNPEKRVELFQRIEEMGAVNSDKIVFFDNFFIDPTGRQFSTCDASVDGKYFQKMIESLSPEATQKLIEDKLLGFRVLPKIKKIAKGKSK